MTDDLHPKLKSEALRGLITHPEFELDHPEDDLAEAEIIARIRERVSDMLDREPGLLMSYLYRLDVLEHKIQTALQLHRGGDIPTALAALIWERQLERAATKRSHQSSGDIADHLRWT